MEISVRVEFVQCVQRVATQQSIERFYSKDRTYNR